MNREKWRIAENPELLFIVNYRVPKCHIGCVLHQVDLVIYRGTTFTMCRLKLRENVSRSAVRHLCHRLTSQAGLDFALITAAAGLDGPLMTARRACFNPGDFLGGRILLDKNTLQ